MLRRREVDHKTQERAGTIVFDPKPLSLSRPGQRPRHAIRRRGGQGRHHIQGEVDTINRIHGAAKPAEAGRKVTAGCIGLLNVGVIRLYDRAAIGTRAAMPG